MQTQVVLRGQRAYSPVKPLEPNGQEGHLALTLVHKHLEA